MDTENKFEHICRCCLTEEGVIKNMLKEDHQHNLDVFVSLLDCYKTCSGLDFIGEQDNTYANICVECEDKLKLFFDFREMCQTSYQVFKDRLSMLVEVKEEDVSDIEEDEFVYSSSVRDSQPFSQVFVQDSPRRTRASVQLAVVEEKKEQLTPVDDSKAEILLEQKQANDETLYDDDTGFQNDEESEQEEPEPAKVESSKKSKRSGNLKPPSLPKLDVSNIEATYMCFYCDQTLSTHKAYIDHRDEHMKERSSNRLNRKCNLCNEDVVGYFRHLEDKHRDYRPNICQICPNGRFQSQNSLKNHLYTHTENTIYKCLACKKTFKNQYNLRCHISTEKHSKTSYHCPYCGLAFKEFLALHEHFKSLHVDKIFKKLYPCYKCKKVFMFKKYAIAHECAAVTPVPVTSKKKKEKKPQYKCEKCDEEFVIKDEFVCHQFLVCEDEPQFICPICGKVCINSQRLSEHKRSHENHVYVCDECGHSTTSEPKLLRHKITHTSERHFKCTLCSATFKNKYSLRTHQRVHNERKYECYLCSKKFRFYNTVKQHMATHVQASALRKYNCDFCDKTFIRPRDRERHLKIHTDDRPMKCNSCPKEFRDTGAKNDHIRRVHEGIYYECSFCSKKYVRKMELSEHLFIHRGFKPFMCPVCPQGFIKKWVMKKHLLTHNIQFDEKVHGYREKENLRDIIAASVRTPKRGDSYEQQQPTAMEVDTAEGQPRWEEQGNKMEVNKEQQQHREHILITDAENQPVAECSYSVPTSFSGSHNLTMLANITGIQSKSGLTTILHMH